MARGYRSAVHGRGLGQVVVIREAWVGLDTNQARATYTPAITPVYRYYVRNGAIPLDGGDSEAELAFQGAVERCVIVGSPTEVAADLAALVEATGAETVVLALRHPGGPPHGAVLDAIRLVGTEVQPRLLERLSATMPSRKGSV
jgi:alkanesulfonate monooxygenase SsuD/methylene tetrahydromethanopterin reductase-like flavin-dependent oxidoreductase (luciferase family)